MRQEAWRRPIDGYLLIDPDGVVSWADAAAAALLRRAPEELAGRPATVVLPGLDSDRAAGTELVATEPGGRELSLRVRVEPAAAGEAYRLAVLSPPHAPGMVSRETFERILTAVDVHPYSGEILEDGTYVEFYTGPNEDAVLGGPVPPGEDSRTAWIAAIHDDDRERYEWFLTLLRMSAPRAAEVEYRMVGRDGVTRWVRETARTQRGGDGRVLLDGIVVSLAESRRTAEALAEAEVRMSAAMRLLEDVLFEGRADQAGRWRLRRIGDGPMVAFGLPLAADADLGTLWRACVHPDDASTLDRLLERMSLGEPCQGEFCIVLPDGSQRCLWMRAVPYPGLRERLVAGIATDITERRRAAQELARARDRAERLARVDALTDVYNRRHFRDVLARELARATRERSTLGLLLIDADHFKRINDTFGHRAGDNVLIELARRIQGAVRPYDTVARWGGEEFACLLPGVRDRDELLEVAERVREAVASGRISAAGRRVSITISVGAAAAGAALDGEVPWSTDGVVDAADRALYAAKRAGRNRVRLYQDVQADELSDEGPDALRIAEALLVSASARQGTGEQHAALVSAVAAALAEQAQLPYETVLRSRVAGLLHDIGKSAIPDRVLFKRAPLEHDERSLLETHVAVGERMARRFPAVADASQGIRHHHEHWDGTGYPDQLGGEAIPIEARIVAVADAYAHAVGDELPSSPAQRLAAAERLADGAGTELDPTLVALLGGAIGTLRVRAVR